jgi:hypothetical protein
LNSDQTLNLSLKLALSLDSVVGLTLTTNPKAKHSLSLNLKTNPSPNPKLIPKANPKEFSPLRSVVILLEVTFSITSNVFMISRRNM